MFTTFSKEEDSSIGVMVSVHPSRAWGSEQLTPWWPGSREAEPCNYWFAPFHSIWAQAYGMVPPTFRWVFPLSLWKPLTGTPSPRGAVLT
jgi:hypothetical protein